MLDVFALPLYIANVNDRIRIISEEYNLYRDIVSAKWLLA